MGIQDLREKVVLVTGASSGIGRETATVLARSGARVALTARREDRLESLADEIHAGGGQALSLPCDVSDRPAVERVVQTIAAEWGPIDVLVNNAGFGDPIPVAQTSVERIEQVMRVNYLGAIYATKAVLGSMLERDAGAIVLVSSVLGHIVLPSMAPYCASKHAMRAFGVGLAGELHGTGVRVSLVCPGGVATDFFKTERWKGKAIGGKPTSPTRVAADILHAIRSGRTFVYTPRYMGLLAWLYPTLGPLGRWLARVYTVHDEKP